MIWLLSCQNGIKDTGSVSESEIIEAVAYAGEDISAKVEETVFFDASSSSGVLFEWDFGDGNQAEGITNDHKYGEPGHYQAVLTATGSDGSRKSDIVLVTIHHPLTDNKASFSSTIAIDDNSVWTVFEEANTLSRISLLDHSMEEFEICQKPTTLAMQNNVIGVACQEDAKLALFNKTTYDIQYVDLPSNSAPYGIAGRENHWWVSLTATGQLAHYNENSVDLIDIGSDPRGVTLLSDGRVIVPRWRSTNEVGMVYLWDGNEVQNIQLHTDQSGDSDNTTGGIPNLLDIAIPTPDGKEILVPMLHSNTIRGLYQNGLEQNHETSLRAILARFSLEEPEEHHTDRKQFDERGRASAIALSPLGDYTYVLHPSTGTITILDTFNQQTVGSILNIGNMPTGLVLDSSGEKLYIFVWLDRTVKVFDVRSKHQPEHLWTAEISQIEPLDSEILQGKRLFHTASDTRITRSGYIACSHCHPDSDHDGQTWDFTQRGEGMRNTTSLLGKAGTMMGRLHWTGNFDEIQDFEHDIRNEFAGSGLMDDEQFEQANDPLGTQKSGISEDLDALAAYVSSLSDSISSPYSHNSVGEQQFYAVGCAECHPAPLYTDSDTMIPMRHNIGTITSASGQRMGQTIDGFDTPSLLGVWASSPYLHDGSAATLEEAIIAHTEYANTNEETVLSIAQFIQSL
jgi:hypothetical protein